MNLESTWQRLSREHLSSPWQRAHHPIVSQPSHYRSSHLQSRCHDPCQTLDHNRVAGRRRVLPSSSYPPPIRPSYRWSMLKMYCKTSSTLTPLLCPQPLPYHSFLRKAAQLFLPCHMALPCHMIWPYHMTCLGTYLLIRNDETEWRETTRSWYSVSVTMSPYPTGSWTIR